MRRLLGVVLWLTMSLPAAANWQYTRWGMTPAQVTAASHHTASETTPEEQAGERIASTGEVALLTAPWQSEKFRFTTFFFFSPGKRLTHVELKLQDPAEGAALLGSLRQKYGAAFDTKSFEMMSWEIWHYKGDQISYTVALGKLFSVEYAPLANGDNGAL